ncbi:hypothetical protein VmeM32_00228 [Vibrio phage vB_VmeM-32]|nr:hypothetical protein VmeM32_00228 [Vibrio phage vB_VmeM-32]
MSESKLRFFKLVDKDGYFGNNPHNINLWNKFGKEFGAYSGFIINGSLYRDYDYMTRGPALIYSSEFKYFEEITQIEDSKYPEIGSQCEYTAMESGVWHQCTFIGIVNDLVYVDVPHLESVQKFNPKHIQFREIQPKWQEVLCEEYDIELDKHNWIFNVSRNFTESDLIRFAKRVLELSNKN